jgi:hypothetical protein
LFGCDFLPNHSFSLLYYLNFVKSFDDKYGERLQIIEEIIQARVEKNITQKELAELIGTK